MEMQAINKALNTFSQADLKSFEPDLKIGLLATLNEDGLPHITLITTITATSPQKIIWGQFTEGLSKNNIKKNPKAGFLIMTLDRNMWRGKAFLTDTANKGPEFEKLNNTPMFRYNAYFGIHTVYYMDLIEHLGKEPLPMNGIVQAAVKTMVAKTLAGKGSGKEVLTNLTHKLIDKIDNLKFIAYVDKDGYPILIPVIQAQTAGNDRIIFSSSVFNQDLKGIPSNVPVALFCMSFEMQTVLVRGIYKGIRNIGAFECGEIEVNWVYNPMPPKPQQVYPPIKLERVTVF
jgi:hypothetical protein